MQQHVLVWFQRDFRLQDNPAFFHAVQSGLPVVAMYVYDPAAQDRPLGAASRWWLHHALVTFSKQLQTVGATLIVQQGDSRKIIPDWAQRLHVSAVFVNAHPDIKATEQLDQTERLLVSQGRRLQRYADGLLLPHPMTLRAEGYRVFAPFWNALLQAKSLILDPYPEPTGVRWSTSIHAGDTIDSLQLLPKIGWDKGFRDSWVVGEKQAQRALQSFVSKGLHGYKQQREIPGIAGTSELSPYFCFGEISVRTVWHAVERSAASIEDKHAFLREVAWREFAYHLLSMHPDLSVRNIKPAFDLFPWRWDPLQERAWQQGQTGYPWVDAGMRQLWQTGWMHNRVRMGVASFLVKHLGMDWRLGERWFWDTLVDADPASNAMNWQWVSGCGVDASPFFRIFSPVRQGEKFDPDGSYVRRYIPELARLPSRWVHNPWLAPAAALQEAGIVLGKDYPFPVVDHQMARKRALSAFAKLSNSKATNDVSTGTSFQVQGALFNEPQ